LYKGVSQVIEKNDKQKSKYITYQIN
jgi:hypothetical protein